MNKKISRILKPNTGLYLFVLLAFAVLSALFGSFILAVVELLVAVLAFIAQILYRAHRRKVLQNFLQEIGEKMTDSQYGHRTPFATVVIRLDDHGILHANDGFVAITGHQDVFKEALIDSYVPDFDTRWLLDGKTEYPQDVTFGNRRYRIYGAVERDPENDELRLGVLYFSDLTELYQVRDEYIRSRPVVSIVLVDNYEELTRNMTEAAISAMDARINDTILNWAQQYHGLLRRLEKNRFLLLFEKQDLKKAMDEKFSVLEDIHEITAPSGLSASISLGLGVDGVTFAECFDFAALSIEMALSRGGDQAVVKDRLNFRFFGGRSKETEHRSKVRSRVTANSLMELIGQSDRIFIMGHKNADLDSLGAAMGIACLCRKKEKPFHIVLDLEQNSVGDFLEEIRGVPEYKNAFITGQEALLLCDNRSTLIVVDTNRPDQVEFAPLLEAIPKICVVDHHRRAADYIKPVVVNFHEPYASSASELATELLEYAVERKDILPMEAKSLMAGIFLDTKSFNVRTGERTFEAAAYLRQLGADTVEVKKLLQNDFKDTVAKHQIIKAARLYRQQIAISALTTETSRILAAQAADELLNISGITASFVLFPDEGRVIVSARSIGQVNVQVVLEALGGGGNAATAGAQISDKTVKEVLDELVSAIDKYFEN